MPESSVFHASLPNRSAIAWIGIGLGLAVTAAAHADVTLNPLFSNGAVLQRDLPIPIWGTGSDGEKITVRFAGQQSSTIAGADKKFVPAEAIIRGDRIEVTHLAIRQSHVVRFGWAAAPELNLFNKEGLPAMPFRTDSPFHNP